MSKLIAVVELVLFRVRAIDIFGRVGLPVLLEDFIEVDGGKWFGFGIRVFLLELCAFFHVLDCH